MTTDSIVDRECELITYLRNNITDPSTRGTQKVDTIISTSSQTTFPLSQTLVKNIISVTIDSVQKHQGYHYTILYGEGSAITNITMRTACTTGQSVVITYRYGT
jgi:hypothetical protein